MKKVSVKCEHCGLTSEMTEASFRTRKYRPEQKCKKCKHKHLYCMIGQTVNKTLTIKEYGKNYKHVQRSTFLLECSCGHSFRCKPSDLKDVKCSRCSTDKGMFQRRPQKPKTIDMIYNNCRNSAKARDIPFNICKEDILSLLSMQNNTCALSGIPISIEDSASIDRIDSSLGYDVSNIQLVHKVINVMKSSLEQKEFIDWCAKIVQHSRF